MVQPTRICQAESISYTTTTTTYPVQPQKWGWGRVVYTESCPCLVNVERSFQIDINSSKAYQIRYQKEISKKRKNARNKNKREHSQQ